MGDKVRLYPRSNQSRRFFGANHRPDSVVSKVLMDNYRLLRIAFLQLFPDHLERLHDFALQIAEVGSQR